MFSRSTNLLRSSLRTTTPLANRTFASTTLLRNSTANASQSTHDAEQARDQGEQKIYDKLKTKFTPKTLDVMDVSGSFMVDVKISSSLADKWLPYHWLVLRTRLWVR